MKRNIMIIMLLALTATLTLSCSLNALRPFPYGKWENAEIGLVLDVNPQNRGTNDRFYGTLIENGEEIEVSVFFLVTGGGLWILREPDWGRRGGNQNTETTIFGGNYILRGERLHYRLWPFWQEQTGITDTIIFERIVDYSDLVDGSNDTDISR